MDNIHDKIFRENLSDINNAVAFLQNVLPTSILSLLDLGTLSMTNTTFISEDLKELFSDIIFSCKLINGKESYCSLIIEHKSYLDPYVGFQIGEYIFAAYRTQIKNRQPLKIIIPIIFYHHQKKWIYRPIEDYFEGFPEDLKAFIPKFDVIFSDVKNKSDEEIINIRNTAIASMFITQKHNNNIYALFENLGKIYEALQTNQERNSFQKMIVYAFRSVESISNQNEIKDIILKKINEPANKLIMSLYDMLINEGEAKGEARGEARGEVKGIEKTTIQVVLKGFDNKIEIAILANLTTLSEADVIKILKDHGKM